MCIISMLITRKAKCNVYIQMILRQPAGFLETLWTKTNNSPADISQCAITQFFFGIHYSAKKMLDYNTNCLCGGARMRRHLKYSKIPRLHQ